MDDKKNILDELKKRQKPSVPEGFFESFSDGLMKRIEEDNVLDDVHSTTKPEVPEGFFDSFAANLMAKINEEKSLLDGLQKLLNQRFRKVSLRISLLRFLTKFSLTIPCRRNQPESSP